MSFQTKLIDLLKTDPRFVDDDGELVLAAVHDRDWTVKDFQSIGKEADGLEKQKHLLAELLDKNQLYVNLSEIDDSQFKVSQGDKALNKAFYGGVHD